MPWINKIITRQDIQACPVDPAGSGPVCSADNYDVAPEIYGFAASAQSINCGVSKFDPEVQVKRLHAMARKYGPDPIVQELEKMSQMERALLGKFIDEHYVLSPELKLDKYTLIRDAVSMGKASSGADAVSPQTLAVKISFITDASVTNQMLIYNDGIYRVLVTFKDEEGRKKYTQDQIHAIMREKWREANTEDKRIKEIIISKDGVECILEKDDGMAYALRQLDRSGMPEPFSSYKVITKKYIRADGSEYVVEFKFIDEAAFNGVTKEDAEKMYRIVEEMNKLMPGQEVNKVVITTEDTSSEYKASEHSLRLSIADKMLPGSTAHEMGHAVFSVSFAVLSGQLRFGAAVLERADFWAPDDMDLRYLAQLSKIENSYEMVDDSNYDKASLDDRMGHPNDCDTELFASAFQAYYLHADAFAAAIQDKSLPESWRRFGIAIWVYMRDRVWNGAVFTSDGRDPFADIRWSDHFQVCGA